VSFEQVSDSRLGGRLRKDSAGVETGAPTHKASAPAQQFWKENMKMDATNEVEIQSSGAAEPASADAVVTVEPVAEPEVESAAVESAAVDTSTWRQPETVPVFKSLSPLARKLLIALYRHQGDRLKAVEEAMDVSGEAARLAALQFDRGALAIGTDQVQGLSERDVFLKLLARAIRSKKTTAEQVELLKVEAAVRGFAVKE
jgi:hypothetical protein